jgi:hypothetical protein
MPDRAAGCERHTANTRDAALTRLRLGLLGDIEHVRERVDGTPSPCGGFGCGAPAACIEWPCKKKVCATLLALTVRPSFIMRERVA